MRIPFWQRHEAHPTRTLDRVSGRRSARKLIGLFIPEDFSRVEGCLIRVRGTGKHVRAQLLHAVTMPIEQVMQEMLVGLAASDEPKLADWKFAGSELALFQARCATELLGLNTMSRDDVVAIGSLDPGISCKDFEGKPYHFSVTDSFKLAQSTAMTVVNQFAERDLMDGGSGQSLLPLPYWLLLADRDEKIADESRLLVGIEPGRLELIELPASDGLDSLVPDVRYETTDCVSGITQNCNPEYCVGEVSKYLGRRSFAIDRILLAVKSPDLELELFEKAFQACRFDRGHGHESPVAVTCVAKAGFPGGTIDSAAVALLANAYVDQFPMSLPQVTGNARPRVLGTATPGSLSQFQKFMLESSKITPNIMRLRDAV